MATRKWRQGIVPANTGHEEEKHHRDEQHGIKEDSEPEVVELETHRGRLATESSIMATMVTATKEKAAFHGSGRSEALQSDSERA
jgi:hypothetical protein